MLKTKVSAQISLNELFLRLMNLHEEMSNHDITLNKTELLLQSHTLIPDFEVLEEIEGKVSCYAYHFTVLNLAQGLKWRVQNKPLYYKVFQEKEEDGLKIFKKNNLLSCSCYFYCNMKIPCQHILVCLIRSTDTEGHKILMQNLLQLYHPRWYVNEEEEKEVEKLKIFVKNFQFDEKSRQNQIQEEIKNQKEDENQEIQESQDSKEKNKENRNVPPAEDMKVKDQDYSLPSTKSEEETDTEESEEKFVLNPLEVKKPGRSSNVVRIASYFEINQKQKETS